MWLFDLIFPQFCKSDMSRYGYLEVFQRVRWNLRYRESTVYYLGQICHSGFTYHEFLSCVIVYTHIRLQYVEMEGGSKQTPRSRPSFSFSYQQASAKPGNAETVHSAKTGRFRFYKKWILPVHQLVSNDLRVHNVETKLKSWVNVLEVESTCTISSSWSFWG